MSKRKGTRNERELLHMFWDTGAWVASRMAGSGSVPLPSPDLIAGSKKRLLAIECKSLKGTSKFIENSKIAELVEFSTKMNAEPWIAIRFDNVGWYFLKPHTLKQSTSGNYSISLALARKEGLLFHELINQ